VASWDTASWRHRPGSPSRRGYKDFGDVGYARLQDSAGEVKILSHLGLATLRLATRAGAEI
jgi:hypothetical protein